jgi:hypothetical protein
MENGKQVNGIEQGVARNWLSIAILIAILYPMVGAYKFDREMATKHAENHLSGQIFEISQILKSATGKIAQVDYDGKCITMIMVEIRGKLKIWTCDDPVFLRELNSVNTKTFPISVLIRAGIDPNSIQNAGFMNKTGAFDLALVALMDSSIQLPAYNSLAVSKDTAFAEFFEAEGQKDGSTPGRSVTQFFDLLYQDSDKIEAPKTADSKSIDIKSMSKEEKANYFKQNPQLPKKTKEPADKKDFTNDKKTNGLSAPDGVWPSQYQALLTNPIFLALVANIKNSNGLTGFTNEFIELVRAHFKSLVITIVTDPVLYQELTGDRQLALGSDFKIPSIPEGVDEDIANAIHSGALPSSVPIVLTKQIDRAEYVYPEVSLAIKIALELTPKSKARPAVAAPSTELVVEKTKKFSVFSIAN